MRQQSPPSIFNRSVVAQRTRHQKFRLFSIANNRRRSAINRQPRPLRLHQRRNLFLRASRKHAIHQCVRHHSLVVIRNNHSIDPSKRPNNQARKFFLGLRIKRLPRFPVHAHNLLIPRNNSSLQSSRPAPIRKNSLPRKIQRAQAAAQRRPPPPPSPPATPNASTRAPSAAIFAATFPAPPKHSLSFV